MGRSGSGIGCRASCSGRNSGHLLPYAEGPVPCSPVFICGQAVAWRADLNRCICRSRRRVGWRETSTGLFKCLLCRRSTWGRTLRFVAAWLLSLSVMITLGLITLGLITLGTCCRPRSSLRKNRLAARVSRRLCPRISSAIPFWSTARHSQCFGATGRAGTGRPAPARAAPRRSVPSAAVPSAPTTALAATAPAAASPAQPRSGRVAHTSARTDPTAAPRPHSPTGEQPAKGGSAAQGLPG